MSQMRQWRDEITRIRRELHKLSADLKALESEISMGVDD